MSRGLLRARAPFRAQNAITGLVLAGFTTAVWAYSIRAVKQDDFSDVDDEAREMMRGRQTQAESASGSPNSSLDVDVDVLGLGTGGSHSESTRTIGVDISPQSSPRPRGVFAPILDRTFPRLLDPASKTLVWGAPPLDDLGRVRLRSSEERR